jgi:hypothetical protein
MFRSPHPLLATMGCSMSNESAKGSSSYGSASSSSSSSGSGSSYGSGSSSSSSSSSSDGGGAVSHIPCPTVHLVTCPPEDCKTGDYEKQPLSAPPNCPSVHITCPQCIPSHPAYSCFPCPTVHHLTCPPGHCPPSHPNVSCHPCPSTQCGYQPPPTHQHCPPSAAPHLCVSLPFCPTETCPPTHLLGCTVYPTAPHLCPISGPATVCVTRQPGCEVTGFTGNCGGANPYQPPQRQGGGRPLFYRGGRTGTYNPYGDD